MGGNEIGIDPRGNVTACKLLTEDVHIAGNIRQTQLSDVFTSGPLADLRSNSVLAGNNLRDCRSCYVRGGCGGGCRAFHMAHSGDLKRNSRSLCRILRHQLIASMWAAAGVDMEKFVELGDAPFHPHLVATGERHPAYGDQGPARPGDEDEGALTTSQPRSRLRMTGGKP
jgi:radical SAM protein with 4Fe4S-binding SPASM domain